MSEDIPPWGTLEFLRQYYEIEEALVELLNIDWENPDELSPMAIRLHERYATLREMAMQGDIRVGLRLARLGMLAENLRILREDHPHIYSDFKSDFHKIKHNRYFGWRCEVDTAAVLTRWGEDFTHPDPPDFQLTRRGETVSIECTSAHYRGSNVDIEEKVKDAVSSKTGKPYISPSTTLFIDVTNLYHNAVAQGENPNSESLKDWVRDRTDLINMEIGSVVLLAYIGQMEEIENARVPLIQATDRVDISPSEALKDFLDEHIAFGEGSKEVRWFPPEP